MPRAKRGVKRRRRVKKILKIAKGAMLMRGHNMKAAKHTAMRSGVYAYRDRRRKKREARRLWIVRINAAVTELGFRYSVVMNWFKKAAIALDRKSLAELAANDPTAFGKVVEAARAKAA